MTVDQTSYHTSCMHISSDAGVFAQRAENEQRMTGDNLGEVRPSCIVAACILVDSGEGDGLIAVSGLLQDRKWMKEPDSQVRNWQVIDIHASRSLSQCVRGPAQSRTDNQS